MVILKKFFVTFRMKLNVCVPAYALQVHHKCSSSFSGFFSVAWRNISQHGTPGTWKLTEPSSCNTSFYSSALTHFAQLFLMQKMT